MKTSRSRLNAQSPNKPRLLAEKGGLIFARVWYTFHAVLIHSRQCQDNYNSSNTSEIYTYVHAKYYNYTRFKIGTTLPVKAYWF